MLFASNQSARPSWRLVSFFISSSRTRIYRVNQVSERKQRDTQDRARQIEIMANAVLSSPTHAGEETKCFEYVGENHDHQARCTKELQKGGNALFS